MSYVVEVVRDVTSYSEHRAGVNHLITTRHEFDSDEAAAAFAQREANITGRTVKRRHLVGKGEGAMTWTTTVEPSL